MLNFVLLRLPLGLHVPCDVLGDLWGDKVKFRKLLYTLRMTHLLGEFGIYVSEMRGRGRMKGIVLLGPGVAKPVDACEQPLGDSRALIRPGNADRAALIQKWTAPRDTSRKLRVSEGGERTTWTAERTPARDFDPRVDARVAEAMIEAEDLADEADKLSDGSGNKDTPSNSRARDNPWRGKPIEDAHTHPRPRPTLALALALALAL